MQYLKLGWQFILAIPKILEMIRALVRMKKEMEYARKQKENDEIRKKVEDAKSDEEAQSALDSAANRLGRM